MVLREPDLSKFVHIPAFVVYVPLVEHEQPVATNPSTRARAHRGIDTPPRAEAQIAAMHTTALTVAGRTSASREQGWSEYGDQKQAGRGPR